MVENSKCDILCNFLTKWTISSFPTHNFQFLHKTETLSTLKMLLEHATKLMVMLCYVVDVKGIILIQSCIPAPKCLEISTDKMLEKVFSSFSFLLSYCCSSAIRAMSHFIPELASSAVRISFRSLLSTMGIENRGMTMWYLGGIFIQSYSSKAFLFCWFFNLCIEIMPLLHGYFILWLFSCCITFFAKAAHLPSAFFFIKLHWFSLFALLSYILWQLNFQIARSLLFYG